MNHTSPPLQVTITAIYPDGTATARDTLGRERTVQASIQRTGLIPAVGDGWLIDRVLGPWTFAARVRDATQGPFVASPTPLTYGIGMYGWTVVPAFRRGLVWRTRVVSMASPWSLQITSQPNGAGEVMLQVPSITSGIYVASTPWVFQNQESPSAPQMHIGISTPTSSLATFNLNDLRAEVFAA